MPLIFRPDTQEYWLIGHSTLEWTRNAVKLTERDLEVTPVGHFVNDITFDSPECIERVRCSGDLKKNSEEIFDEIRRHLSYGPVESEPLFLRGASFVSGAIAKVMEECARLGKDENQVKRWEKRALELLDQYRSASFEQSTQV